MIKVQNDVDKVAIIQNVFINAITPGKIRKLSFEYDSMKSDI